MLCSTNSDTKKKLKDVYMGLHWAAMNGNIGLVKFALDHGVPVDSTVNGFVPLQLCCLSDSNLVIAQYLIDRGADVNRQNYYRKSSSDKGVTGAKGSTALHVACANGCTKMVELLLRNNARIDVSDKYGSTPMDIALMKHEPGIVQLLQKYKTKRLKQIQKSISDVSQMEYSWRHNLSMTPSFSSGSTESFPKIPPFTEISTSESSTDVSLEDKNYLHSLEKRTYYVSSDNDSDDTDTTRTDEEGYEGEEEDNESFSTTSTNRHRWFKTKYEIKSGLENLTQLAKRSVKKGL
ncbi:ankyrin repeat-containing domain protein [Pilobolus umbonatus]|nr:ankyrin repeat-containing domain protein [Pilobolus umbonatus]